MKILQKLGTRLFPYWCPYCPRRYSSESKFHKHYLHCEARLEQELYEYEALERLAPTNREHRRIMAKRAGAIKDWKELNEE